MLIERKRFNRIIGHFTDDRLKGTALNHHLRTAMFELHPQLAKDCVVVGDLPLSRVLLSKDSLYPWLILVPRREGIEEIFQMSLDDQGQLLAESSRVSELMMRLFKADKMNIAALGNMVPQLHVHHIARFKADAAWPKPVWGLLPAKSYEADDLDKLLVECRLELSKNHSEFTVV